MQDDFAEAGAAEVGVTGEVGATGEGLPGAGAGAGAGEGLRPGAREEARARARALKQANRRAFDRLAQTYDDERRSFHARRLYRHVLWQLAGLYREWLCRERREGRVGEDGEPERRFRVLDVGCGTGLLAAYVLDAMPYVRLVGVDLSERMVDVARERLGGGARLFCADAERLPFSEGAFDVVIMNDTIHHLPDAARAVFEAWRVLGRHGVLVVGEICVPALLRALRNLAAPLLGEGDVYVRTEPELTGLLGSWFHRVAAERVNGDAILALAAKSPVDRR